MEPLIIQQRLNSLGYTIQPMFPNFGPKTRQAVKNFQQDNGLTADGIAGPATLSKLFPEQEADRNYLAVSKTAVDLIVNSEVTSKAYYDKNLRSPCYPGANSGVTIGLGYDLGYNTPAQIKQDWGEFLSNSVLDRLIRVSGLVGAAAKVKISSLKDISILFDDAYKVFLESSLPYYAVMANKAYPGLTQLDPRAAGAILSIVYNRGTSMTGAARREMANLKPLIASKDYKKMAAEIRSMKRLWDGVSEDGAEKRLAGLLTRREEEAVLTEAAAGTPVASDIIKIHL